MNRTSLCLPFVFFVFKLPLIIRKAGLTRILTIIKFLYLLGRGGSSVMFVYRAIAHMLLIELSVAGS